MTYKGVSKMTTKQAKSISDRVNDILSIYIDVSMQVVTAAMYRDFFIYVYCGEVWEVAIYGQIKGEYTSRIDGIPREELMTEAKREIDSIYKSKDDSIESAAQEGITIDYDDIPF
jgi:hypothetical protein